MLTRLKVSGFKNLVDVDVRFGPFTCIAGANGSGKSNLFDAILFLSALADHTFVEAAQLVRDENGRASDIRDIFHRVGEEPTTDMKFECEMIISPTGVDDLGQEAQATITFLRYTLTLGYRGGDGFNSRGPIELKQEELIHINKSDVPQELLFPHSASKWRQSVIRGRRNNKAPFISTDTDEKVVYLHQDGGSRGKPIGLAANTLPRTLLSSTNATESPTALLVRRELQSWRLLQLEPSALRQSNPFTSPKRIDANGAYLASTLYRLAHSSGDPERIFSRISNRLAELLDDVRNIWVESDEKRELYTLYLTHSDGTTHSARSLSDGTLRFLALAILELDPEAKGVICFEEPENGIDPRRLPAILRLLQDITTDVHYPVDDDNPLRQVIINTHSPAVVQQVPDDSLLVAELKEHIVDGQRFTGAMFGVLPNDKDGRTNWRLKAKVPPPKIAKGQLLGYLSPVPLHPDSNGHKEYRRVVDRPDVRDLIRQLQLPFEYDEHD